MQLSITTDRILKFLDLDKLDSQQPRVSAIAVTSVDGRATIDGVSGGLGDNLDARIFNTHRALADVVFVGSGTISAEKYGPVEIPADIATLRSQLGKESEVPIATISQSLSIDPKGPLFTTTAGHKHPEAAPIIFTASPLPRSTNDSDIAIDDNIMSPWEHRRQALVEAGAHIVTLPRTTVHAAIRWLHNAGYAHIACEGGPSVYEQLFRGDDITDLYLTLSPWWVGSGPWTLSGAAPAECTVLSKKKENAQSKEKEECVSEPGTQVSSTEQKQFSLSDSIISDSLIFLHYLRTEKH